MKRIKRHEQVILFLYVLQKGLPEWTLKDGGDEGDRQIAVFAQLMNISTKSAKAAFERARHCGYVDKQ